MERRMTPTVVYDAGEALKRSALVLAGTLLMAAVVVATPLHVFAVRLEDRLREASSGRGAHR